MSLHFSKYHGTGNDFILIDNRSGQVSDLTRAQIAKMCDRRFGIGGDGLILLNAHSQFDFEMKNYNSDGGECTMCGNGARTLVQFAHDLGIRKDHYRFLAIDGEHEAKLVNGQIHVKMQDVLQVTDTPLGHVLNTGSPHLICKTENLLTFDVVNEGRRLRNSPLFMPAGINVNFVEHFGKQIYVRTYERGVEDETLSCGTGVIAAALVSSGHHVETRGGHLEVKFQKTKGPTGEDQYKEIWLIGPAQKTFEGSLS